MKRHVPHLAFVAVVTAVACDAQPTRLPDEAANDGQPYYWHQDERVYLQPDYGRVVVAYEDGLPDAPSLVTRIVDSFGLTVATSEPLTQMDGHHVLALEGDSADAPAAVAALRQQPGIAFVAPAYTLVEGGDTLLLVNELVVRFRDGVTQAAIDDLVETFDTQIVRRSRSLDGINQYRIAYPAGANPLVFAEVMHEHPFVEWVDPNKVGSSYPAL